MPRIAKFDTEYYENEYPKAAKAIKDGQFANLEDHFALKGAAEGYNPNPWFNTTLYKSENHDVADALKAGKFPGVNVFQHFVQHGVYEDRPVPSHLFDGFDAAKYLEANKDVKEHLNDKTLGKIKDAQAHFLIFGAEEMISGKRALSGISSDDLAKIAAAMGLKYTPHGEDSGHQTGGPDGIDGNTYKLTKKTDKYTGTAKNDLFKAVVDADDPDDSTLSSRDSLDGGGETGGDGDVLDLKVEGDVGKDNVLPHASIKHIETLRVQNLTEGNISCDLSRMDGEKNVVSAGGYAQGVPAADEFDEYRNLDDAATMVISGPVKLEKGESKDAFKRIHFSTESDENEAHLRLEGSVRNAAVSLTSSNPSLVMTAADGLNVLNELSLRSDTKTWNIDGDGKVQINAVKASGLETVDASKNKGGVTLDLSAASALAKVTGGSGDDVVYVGRQFTAKGEKVDGGAGNDTLFFETGSTIEFKSEKEFSDHYSGFESIGLAGDGGKIDLAHVNMPFVFDPNKGSKDVTATVIAPADIKDVGLTVYAPLNHNATLNLGFKGSLEPGAAAQKATVEIVDQFATGSSARNGHEKDAKNSLTFSSDPASRGHDPLFHKGAFLLASWQLTLQGVDKVEELVLDKTLHLENSTVMGDDKDSNIRVAHSVGNVYIGGKGNDAISVGVASEDTKIPGYAASTDQFQFAAGDSSYSWDKGNAVASSDSINIIVDGSDLDTRNTTIKFESELTIHEAKKIATAGHAHINGLSGEAEFDNKKDKTVDQKLEAIATSIGSSDKGSFAWFSEAGKGTYLYISDGVSGFDHDSDVVVRMTQEDGSHNIGVVGLALHKYHGDLDGLVGIVNA